MSEEEEHILQAPIGIKEKIYYNIRCYNCGMVKEKHIVIED